MATSETSADAADATEEAAGPSMPPKVSIVVPAYNEAARIAESIKTIQEYLARVPFAAEVLIVDDGSQDQTSSVVEGLRTSNIRLIRHDQNHGKGYAVQAGVLAATGDYVLFSDADLSAPIEELEKLLQASVEHDADIVVGSRALDRSFIEKHQSTGRELGGILFNMMVQVLLGLRIHDTQCGFKLFKRKKTRPIFEKLTIVGFGFDPELLFLASKAGLKTVEISVRWSHAEGSKIRFLRDGLRMFGDLLRIRWNFVWGRYT